MSSERVYLSLEEQLFLMEMLELPDPRQAAEKFAAMMAEERADPTQMQKYLQKILKEFK